MSDDFYTVGEVLGLVAAAAAANGGARTEMISGLSMVEVQHRTRWGTSAPSTYEPRLTYFTLADAISMTGEVARNAGIAGFDTPIPKHLPALPNIGGGGGGAIPPAPNTPPINPIDALKLLAEAVSEAERTLNGKNLVIATGTLDVDLNVDIGGVAGAHATLSLRIEPKPYGRLRELGWPSALRSQSPRFRSSWRRHLPPSGSRH